LSAASAAFSAVESVSVVDMDQIPTLKP
jgi:hypothetical protein